MMAREITWTQRIDNYTRVTGFPRALFEIPPTGEVAGLWVMGNDYRVKSGLYGGYPAGYLRRIAALFPDRRRVLHLFSGLVDLVAMPGDTFDCRPETVPTYIGDAHEVAQFPLELYDLVLADPPYSSEDSEHYGTPMVQRSVVIRELARVLRPSARVVWLDQVLPMYRKTDWKIEARIGMVKSTNHRFRVITIFRKR